MEGNLPAAFSCISSVYANSLPRRRASGSPRRATPPHAVMTGEMCHHVKAAVEVEGGGGHPFGGFGVVFFFF